MTNSLEDEIQRIVASMENEEQKNPEPKTQETTEPETEPGETIHIHYFPDAIVILKEDENTAQVVDSTPVIPQKMSVIPAYAICVFYLFLIFSCIAFQVYTLLNPPIATITIIPKAQTVTLSGTLQLGRLLNPLTISQSQTVPTTGKGHQDAKQARGTITFYNGQLSSISIPAGTILTASTGAQVSTEQNTIIPAAAPPTEGAATTPAHAITTGTHGNIAARSIDEACCAISVLAVNLSFFTGGQEERNFQTVAISDIDTASAPLKTAVARSMQGALQGQVKQAEQLQILPCSPIVTSDHQIREEAREVKVTVSETCSGIAYNSQAVEEKATALLTHQAATKPGTSYSLFGEVKVTVTQATITHTPHTLVFLSFQAQGTWVYALSQGVREQIKVLIAGNSKQRALQILRSMPGVEQAAIVWGDDTRLPKNSSYIHITLLVA